MHDPFAMRLVEGIRDLDGVLKCLIEGQRSLLQSPRQRLGFQILHDEEVDTLLPADIEHRADVGMTESGECLGLTLETFAERKIVADVRR